MNEPFVDDRPRPKPPVHEIGQDLATLSLAELDERVAALTAEIERLKAARTRKEASRNAADSVFKL
ncbi:DUF1192 domain-containing protein [Chelatococcus reniformis]|uniref:DUF1192 domain-containing protein n=1 Tax=Chelatococcus reniformis TaxID=1494448 RepID=A0A916XEA4_9HYPH|nr:DUF1192 domain-containing protein [Chelatococcus reniformis]GGC64180.1 hypothetical protein GCM10010994_23530 [Chelatococcus reniformis]